MISSYYKTHTGPESPHVLEKYNTMRQLSSDLGLPLTVIKSAKRDGCDAFVNSRVLTKKLLRWVFARGDVPVRNWSDALKEYQAEREKLKLRRESEELVDKAGVSEAIQKMLATLSSEFDKLLLNEGPPIMRGLDEMAIRKNLQRIMWDCFSAARRKVDHLIEKVEAALAANKRNSVVEPEGL